MKTPLLGAFSCALVLSGCVLPSPPPLVTVQESRPVVYESRTVYQPGYTVSELSPGYRTVRRGRSVYYVDRDTYYRRQRNGYVVVQRPY